MTQEEKQLLFIDLCARLPYGVKVHSKGIPHEQTLIGFIPDIEHYNIKPYLRLTSSMTDEEKTEYFLLRHRDNDRDDNMILLDEASALIDWLNKNKFDYRGLIPMGLALKAPEDMYNIK